MELSPAGDGWKEDEEDEVDNSYERCASPSVVCECRLKRPLVRPFRPDPRPVENCDIKEDKD